MSFSETPHGAPDCPPDSINVLHQPAKSYTNNDGCEISHHQQASNSSQKDPNQTTVMVLT